MNISVYNQLLNLFIFTLTGIIIGILFDVFRIMRKSFKTPDFITYIEDVIFWILTGIILLFTIFTFNNGEIRIYLFIGLLLGLCFYILNLSKYFIKINVTIIKFFKKILYIPIHIILNFTSKFIIRPFSFFYKKINENVTKLIKKPIQKSENANFPNNYHKIDE